MKGLDMVLSTRSRGGAATREPRRSTRMTSGPGRLVRTARSTSRSWKRTGTGRIRWVRRNRTDSACTTRWGTCGSGAETGSTRGTTRSPLRRTRRGRRAGPAVLCVAAPGTTTSGTCASQTAPGSSRRSASSMSASGVSGTWVPLDPLTLFPFSNKRGPGCVQPPGRPEKRKASKRDQPRWDQPRPTLNRR